MIEAVIQQIKSLLTGFDEQKMHNEMRKHYEILHLIDENGKWAAPALQKVSDYLLPSNITEAVAKDFVDQMGALAMTNPCFVDMVKALESESFPFLSGKVAAEGHIVIPYAVAWAFVLERMTTAMYDDPAVTRSCVELFNRVRKSTNLFKRTPPFYRVKLFSIEYTINKGYLRGAETGRVEPADGKWTLPIHIIEATIADYVGGRRYNARASLPLIANGPGTKQYDPRTGAGPSTLSEDTKVPCRSMPFPREWADLYQSWNMAFVTHLRVFPYVLPKLFIPKVADYKDRPTEYSYARALSLYLAVYHYGLSRIGQKHRQLDINWYDKKLTRLWGKVNLESSKRYKKAVADGKL